MVWRPIAELPDETLRDLVFWNPCQGPLHEPIMLAEEAEGYRNDCFSFFLILPASTPDMVEVDRARMQALHD